MALSTIDEFLGYGVLAPRVLFLGTEESAGGSEPRANERAKLEHFEPVMDLAAGTAIWANVPDFVDPFAEKGNGVEQWNRAAEIRLALAQQPWKEVRQWSSYWRTFLGALRATRS